MSHFTRIKTQINNLITLKQTLKDLNIDFTESDTNTKLLIKGWDNQSQEVLLELKNGGPYSIGLVFNDKTNTYEFIADWWGAETYIEKSQENYINEITQRYAYNTVMMKIKTKGYEIINEDTDEHDNIRIVLRKWE